MEKEHVRNYREYFEAVVKEVGKLVVGQEEVVRHVFTGILAGGHILLEGVPGLGKTVLVKTFARVLDLTFSRIQFTPDLMPVDITGTSLINKTEEGLTFVFQKGPIFSALVLADEINRATPKTQSAMLEAMQERTVTVGRETYPLPEPFFVLATQNPLEMEGTYRLPEAQLDRFMFKLDVALPDRGDIYKIMDLTVSGHDAPPVRRQTGGQEILEMGRTALQLPVASRVKEAAVSLMLETNPARTTVQAVKDYVAWGAGLRSVQSMLAAAKVKALSEGRFHAAGEDVFHMALPALRHRIILNFRAQAEKVKVDDIIGEILKKVK